MITPEKIDKILNRFDAELKGIENVMINRLRKVVLSKLTDNELIDFFTQIDLFQEISNSGYQAAINNLQADYVKVMNEIVKQAKAKGLDRVAGVGLANLDTLIQSDLNQVLRSGSFVSEQLRSGLLRAFIQGIPRKQIADEILPSLQAQIPFNPIWLKTAINQSLTNFQNTTIAAVFEDSPGTKFELIHIFDKDTRPLCKHAIDNMKKYPDGLTIEQINSGKLYEGYSKRSKSEPDNYTFENRGGFNCRGYWKLLEISDAPIKSKPTAGRLPVITPTAQPQAKASAYIPVQNIGEAHKRLNDLGIKKVNLKGLQTNQMDSVIQAVYNNKEHTLNSIIVENKPKHMAKATYYTGSKEIRINLAFIGKASTRPKSMELQIKNIDEEIENMKTKYLGNDSYTQSGVIKHIRQLKNKKKEIQNRIDEGYKDKEWSVSYKEKDGVLATMHHEIGHNYFYTLLDKAERTSFAIDKKNAITQYAETNAEEYFAEWFAHWRLNGSKDIPKDLLKIFESKKWK